MPVRLMQPPREVRSAPRPSPECSTACFEARALLAGIDVSLNRSPAIRGGGLVRLGGLWGREGEVQVCSEVEEGQNAD